MKDGLCDRMREDTDDRAQRRHPLPHLQLALHLGPTQAHLYVDASGESLFKRGWREDKGDAPLKETLAAAMLAAAGWKGTPDEGGALMDPFAAARAPFPSRPPRSPAASPGAVPPVCLRDVAAVQAP